MHISYLSLGSNLGDRLQHLENAIYMLVEQGVEAELVSSLYQSEPWGFASDHWFLNQVVRVNSDHTPEELLSIMHDAERYAGRIRKEMPGYADRVLDIDLLFYDDLIIDSPALKVPHPRLAERKFVLEPLNEIAPALMHPVYSMPVHKLLEICTDETVVQRYQSVHPSTSSTSSAKTL